jgi:hypothetical protein
LSDNDSYGILEQILSTCCDFHGLLSLPLANRKVKLLADRFEFIRPTKPKVTQHLRIRFHTTLHDDDDDAGGETTMTMTMVIPTNHIA